jgi:hypothetical protein
VAVFFNWRAEKRANRVARNDERRLQREEADARLAREAQLSADYLAHEDVQGGRSYTFRVTNVGKEVARHPTAFLMDPQGNPVTLLGYDDVMKSLPVRALLPSASTELELSVRKEALEHDALFLRFEWRDNARKDEPQAYTSLVDVPTS